MKSNSNVIESKQRDPPKSKLCFYIKEKRELRLSLVAPIAQFEVFTASARSPLELGGNGEYYGSFQGARCGTLVECGLAQRIYKVYFSTSMVTICSVEAMANE